MSTNFKIRTSQKWAPVILMQHCEDLQTATPEESVKNHTPPRTVELFCTADFSRAERGEGAIDMATLRKVKKEVKKYESGGTSQCRAIT